MTLECKRFALSYFCERWEGVGLGPRSLNQFPTQEPRVPERVCSVPCQAERVMALPSLSLVVWAAPARSATFSATQALILEDQMTGDLHLPTALLDAGEKALPEGEPGQFRSGFTWIHRAMITIRSEMLIPACDTMPTPSPIPAHSPVCLPHTGMS